MALQFIMGNSGSGKSHFLYQRIIEESRRHPERSYLLIVPEQFTMQTQKDLVMLHPDRGIMNIDVLSFRRLAHRIFEEVGSDRRTVLTETGKNLMLRRVAIEQKEKLQVLGGKMNRPGYVSEVKSVLSELMQYEITDFELQEMLRFSENRPLLHAKLTDIRTLYRAFLEYQRDRFMKPEELLDVLCRVAGSSELLRSSTLAFDGFTGFTPSQMKVLEELLAICPQVWMTVTIDARESFYGEIQEHELFALSKRMIRSVSEAARRAAPRREAVGQKTETVAKAGEHDVAVMMEALEQKSETAAKAGEYDVAAMPENSDIILPPVILGRGALPRFRPHGALAHLEQNLFRRTYQTFRGESDELSMHVSATPAGEVHFAARTICRLVREQGFRYHDIAVITGNMSAYDNYVKKIFPMYEVPAFLDETRHILLNPCLEFIRGALLAVQKDFSCETVLRFLRTGMAGLLPDETDRLENYVLAAGIRGWKRWAQEWTYLPGGMTPEELERCNEYRERAMQQLLPFAQQIKGGRRTTEQYAQALCTLLEDCSVQQQLKDCEVLLLQEGCREEAAEYAQIYGILIALLDEMVELLGSEQVTLQEFSEILDAGFSEARVGIIPPGIDQVQVGDLERSRLAHVKVLFFLGLNDGWVPSRGGSGGIVSDMERELLQETGIELAPSSRENSYIQRFYLYQNITKPSQRLYLSWCSGSGDGAVMRPSYLVSVIGRLFPQLRTVQEQEAGSALTQVTSPKNGLLYLTGQLQNICGGEENPAWLELYAGYLRDERYSSRVRELVQAAFLRGENGRLSYETSRELYGEVLTNSVTRLEQFAACAFAHFAMYGLRLTKRELYGVKAADLGILFHRSIELYSRRLQQKNADWTALPQTEQASLMERCVDEVAQEYGAGVLHGSARDEYTICRVKRILCRAVWALHRQLSAGSFRPTAFEVSFGGAEKLRSAQMRFGENGSLCLKGRIDRIDTAEQDDTVYVKIVDYKSGSTQFDPVSLYYGLQLQLVVYLNAALEMEHRLHRDKKVAPAGIFYSHLDDPVLEKEPETAEAQAEEKLLKKLRPDGVLSGESEVLPLFDRNLFPDGYGESLVVPAGLKKGGMLRAASSTVTEERFSQLSAFVTQKLQHMADEIRGGAIEASPFSDRGRSACDFCEYADVCGFDRRIPGRCKKRVPELRKDEVWARIAQEAEEN